MDADPEQHGIRSIMRIMSIGGRQERWANLAGTLIRDVSVGESRIRSSVLETSIECDDFTRLPYNVQTFIIKLKIHSTVAGTWLTCGSWSSCAIPWRRSSQI